MYGFFDDKTHLYIILEYMDGGTLYEKLKKGTKLCEKDAAYVIEQVTASIYYLHDLGIAHRDLKPENIVISNVKYFLFRMFINYVISVGQLCAIMKEEKLTVVHLTMWLHKFYRVLNTT